jgi:hypothetical protein
MTKPVTEDDDSMRITDTERKCYKIVEEEQK